MRVELAAGEHRLQEVRGVHRALGGTRADDGMELVDEQDDLALGVLDLLQDSLEPLLELAAELGAGDERTEVERHDPLVLESLWHVPTDDPLGEPFDDGRLPDTGLADEDRVVLRPPAEDLDDPPDLVVTTDHGIELSGSRLCSQVAAVLLECLIRALRVGRRDSLAAAHALERLQQRLATGGMPLEEGLGLTTDLGDAEQEVLGGDVFVAEACGFGLGTFDDALGARVEGQRTTRDPGALGEDRRELAAEAGQVDAEAAKRLGRHAVVGLDERGQDVLGVEDRAVEPLSGRLGGDDGLLGLLGESVELHGWPLDRKSVLAGVWLVDDVEERPGGGLRLVGEFVGRMTRVLTYRSPYPLSRNRGMPWPVSRNVLPGWLPAGMVSSTPPFRVSTLTSPPRSASSRVIGSSRSRSAPRLVNRASGRTWTTTTMSPPPGALPDSLIRVPVSAPLGIVISSRLPSTSSSRVVPLYASVSVISAWASWTGFGRSVVAVRPRPSPPMPMPLRMSSNPGPADGRPPDD